MKPSIDIRGIAWRSIREQDPLKQGLKPIQHSSMLMVTIIREQDPLKQGLKPLLIVIRQLLLKIREQDPLKQGLKPQASILTGAAVT